jgi:adenosylcobinamide kinase/adenosylcobinamide-phosphate guanylyltransferase
MQNRIDRHIKKRDNKFTLIEEPLSLYKAISMADSLVLVDCISMWLFNRLQIGHSFDEILDELRAILTLPQDIIFILNDISTSIAPIDKESRDFVDISGLAGGVLAQNCNEVYQVIYTISKRIK